MAKAKTNGPGAMAPEADPEPDPVPPRASSLAEPRRVVVNFMRAGPTFERKLGTVVADHGKDVLDVRVELEHGRTIVLERLAKRPLPHVCTYPSWEEAPAAA